MKSILSICLVVAMLVAGASAESKPVTGCSVKVGNETASMQYFAGNTTVGNEFVSLNLCEIQNLTGCTPKSGYLATYEDGKCLKVYNNRVSAAYDEATKTFTASFSYSADHSFQVSAAETTSVSVKCSPGVDTMEGVMKDGVFTYKSETVCPGYNPHPTDAPSKAPVTEAPSTAVPTAVPTTPTPDSNFTVHGCNMTFNGDTADLAFFHGNATVGNSTAGISPCGKQLFAGCGAKSGYIATYKDNGDCDRVYDVKMPSIFDSANVQFTTEYVSTFMTVWDVARTEDDDDSIFLIVRCKVGDDQLNGKREGNKLIFDSETVCYGYNPNDTPAPTVAPESGLSTGVIVGIVIACIAVLIVIAVIIKIKTGGSDNDGDYERV